jgi:hypothetical protein
VSKIGQFFCTVAEDGQTMAQGRDVVGSGDQGTLIDGWMGIIFDAFSLS